MNFEIQIAKDLEGNF